MARGCCSADGIPLPAPRQLFWPGDQNQSRRQDRTGNIGAVLAPNENEMPQYKMQM